jgi:ATP-dependent DNA helicase RecG
VNYGDIRIFDDRIEFFNPGRLMAGLTTEQLVRGSYVSAIRNKQIATIFKEAGIIEKYGSGIKRVLEFSRLYGLKDPLFEEMQDGFMATIFKTTQKTTQKTSTKEQILAMLRENPNLTRSELAALSGKSQNTIKGHLAALKSEKRLERIGSDRDGHWRVT